MKWFILDHSLSIEYKDAMYLIRPCYSWDGRFRIKGIDIEWFTVQRFGLSGTYWRTYSIPYLMFAKVTLKDNEIQHP